MKKQIIKFNIITSLPGLIESYFKGGMMKKAVDDKYIQVKEYNLRDFAVDKRGSIDDIPYGGGAGMVLRIEPIFKTLNKIKKTTKLKPAQTRTILFSASGKRVTQEDFKRLSKYKQINFICGRYEGVDARVKEFIDEEISLGDFVLTGGELPALILIDGISRLIPGVLGNKESAIDESHSAPGVLEYPQYTRPVEFEYKDKNKKRKLSVPEVLRSGNHALIKKWRDGARGGGSY